MPLSEHGKRMMARMKEEYGSEKGKQVFYASANKGNTGFKGVEGAAMRRLRRREDDEDAKGHGHK